MVRGGGGAWGLRSVDGSGKMVAVAGLGNRLARGAAEPPQPPPDPPRPATVAVNPARPNSSAIGETARDPGQGSPTMHAAH